MLLSHIKLKCKRKSLATARRKRLFLRSLTLSMTHLSTIRKVKALKTMVWLKELISSGAQIKWKCRFLSSSIFTVSIWRRPSSYSNFLPRVSGSSTTTGTLVLCSFGCCSFSKEQSCFSACRISSVSELCVSQLVNSGCIAQANGLRSCRTRSTLVISSWYLVIKLSLATPTLRKNRTSLVTCSSSQEVLS